MRVNTTNYTTLHGREPKGFGMWAFKVDDETFFFTGNYGDAKRQAVKVARERKAISVKLLG